MSVARFICVAFCAGLLFATSASALENCVTPPTCDELGFTANAAECSGAALKCPWDTTKAACKVNSIKPVTCTIGSILGGDQLCYSPSTGTPNGITPVGIVFDDIKQLALALTDVKTDGTAGTETMEWSSGNYDIPSLMNCVYDDNDAELASCSVDGRANTTAILGCGSSCGTTYAANAVNAYAPNGCAADFCKKTKWFLPSIGDWIKILTNRLAVNSSLNLLNSSNVQKLSKDYYWSSTERNNSTAWQLHILSTNRTYDGKSSSACVRPVVYYGGPKTEICVYENQCSGYTLLSGNENWYTFASSGNEINIGAESCTSCGITKWRNSCNATSYEDCFSNNCMDYEPDCIDNPSSEYCNKAKEECAKCCKSCPNAECFSAW